MNRMIGCEKDECNENGCKTKHLFRKNDNNIVALVFTLIFSSWDMIRASKKDIFACGVIDI